MTAHRKKNVTGIILSNMGWPVFWGGLLTVGFYALLGSGVIDSPLMQRYFAAHPVQYLETALFFVGVAAIFMKAMNVVGQFGTLHEIEIVARPKSGQELSDAKGMLDSLAKLPGYARQSYLVRRLEQALEYVHRKGTSSGIDQELKHLSDLDAGRQHDGFALVRIIIWATPMLGFLGTVIGITLALSDLSPQALVSTPETAMDGLLAGLAVAFDTTALALILSIVLMFAQYLTGSLETELLDAVDRRVEAELVGRFKQLGTDTDPHLESIEKMSHHVLENMGQMSGQSAEHLGHLCKSTLDSMEHLVERQAELWNETINAAQSTWNGATREASLSLETTMGTALRDAMRQHTTELAQNEQAANERAERHWRGLQDALSKNAHVVQQQQSELVRQGDILLRTVESIGDVSNLQNALNENLHALAGAGRMDETIANLSAAINLLNARLASADRTNNVRLYDKRGEAA